jgi:ABC-type uncharacterized transport system involved in gliding motility auxiliary subunit
MVHLWAQVGLWIGIAIVVNHASSTWFGRIDLTADQRFSLSPVARATVASLEKPLLATVWFTEDLDPPYHNHRNALADKLAELEARSGGRLSVRWRDPTSDEEAIAEATAAGIQPITYTSRRWDRQVARQVWMGVSLVSGDRQDVADGLVSTAHMEYDLVRAIRAVTTPSEDRPVVGWLQGNGEPDLMSFPAADPLGVLREQLASTYVLRPVAPGADGLPEDLDALLVVGPQREVPDAVQLHLDQFLVDGGAIAWFLAQHQPDYERGVTREVRHGLHALLGHHGATVGRDVLLDRATNERMVAPVSFQGRRVLAQVNHPLALVTSAMDRTYGPVRDLRRAVIPFASPVEPSDSIAGDLESEVWVRTGATATRAPAPVSLDPTVLSETLTGEQVESTPVVVGFSGRFSSFWADRPLPEAVAGLEINVEGQPTRMVVGGSADMVANNPALVLNALDWLLADAALIDIRTRGGGTPPLDAPSPETTLWLKAFIVGAPMSAVLLLFVFARRRVT